MKSKNWIQKAKPKKGVLSKQLDIKESKNIPVSLLKKIIKSKTGNKISNPTKVGKKSYKVTPLLKKRANLALTLKKFHKKSK